LSTRQREGEPKPFDLIEELLASAFGLVVPRYQHEGAAESIEESRTNEGIFDL
jgi:hypothetical protein